MKGPDEKYAWTVKVGEKGQIVIPKEARGLFGIHPGDTLLLLGDEAKGLAVVPKQFYSGLLSQLAAAIGEPAKEGDPATKLEKTDTEGTENA